MIFKSNINSHYINLERTAFSAWKSYIERKNSLVIKTDELQKIFIQRKIRNTFILLKGILSYKFKNNLVSEKVDKSKLVKYQFDPSNPKYKNYIDQKSQRVLRLHFYTLKDFTIYK